MKRLLALLRNGRGLRHAPVVHAHAARRPLRVHLRGLDGGAIDVSEDHSPVSLRPFVLGVRLDAEASSRVGAAKSLCLDIEAADTQGPPLARLTLKPAGQIGLKHGTLHLFEVSRTVNRCLALPRLWLRYLLAWRNAGVASRRGDGLCMSAADLRALNAYYIVARPVFLVGVGHAGRENLFPMDLVARLSSGEQLLALRSTSPSVALMEASGCMVMSSAPAARLEAVYALGRQHRQTTLDLSNVPLSVTRSPWLGLPALGSPALVRELLVEKVERVGSHTLFITRMEREAGSAELLQLAHVSGMYVEWLRGSGQACEVLAPL
jgi:flavin reductase (DIM6/NTAB) family NADH-FMN oxidoreductase RutF